MPIGDGSGWDETTPTNATIATSIDDYDRDVRIGVRSRMAHEHEWPASQSSTAQAGQHKFITLQNQAAKPTVSGTQLAALYTKTVGGGLQELFWENEAGTEVQMTNRSSPGPQIPSVVAYTFAQTSAIITLTGTVPYDTSIPQLTEGTEVFSRSISVPSATHVVEVSGTLYTAESGNTADMIIVSVFENTTANAIRTHVVNPQINAQIGQFVPSAYKFVFTPSTSGTNTYSIRAGCNAGTGYVNANNGTQSLGGVLYSNMHIYVSKTA